MGLFILKVITFVSPEYKSQTLPNYAKNATNIQKMQSFDLIVIVLVFLKAFLGFSTEN